MNKKSTDTSQVPQTMAELLVYIDAMDLPPEYRKALIADVRRAFALHPNLQHARPNGRVVAPILKRLHPVSTGLSAKRLRNIKSAVRRALAVGYKAFPGAQHRTGLGDEWAALFALLEPRSKLQMELSRLAHWAQHKRITPEALRDEHISEFETYLAEVAMVEKPTARARISARHWNIAATTIPGWPPQLLSLPSTRTATRAPGLSELGDACRADLEDYIKLMQTGTTGDEGDQFDLDTDENPDGVDRYTDATVLQRQQLIRRAIGLLAVLTKRPINTIPLSEIVEEKNAYAILKEYKSELGDNGEAPSLLLMSFAILALARHYFKMNNTAVSSLKRLVAKAGKPARQAAKANPGLTNKNRKRLQQIGQAELVALFQAPAYLIGVTIQRIHEGRATVTDLVSAQVGAAIALLLHAPVRGANLASTKIGQHLIFPQADPGQAVLRYEGTETKTKRALEFILPPDVTCLLKRFVTEVLPHFDRSIRTTGLFAGLSNDTKGVSHLGSQIMARIKKLTGVTMNQHLFRHLLACLYLRANPGKYGVVQELLGHASLETTRKYYCGLEGEAAVAHFHDLMAQMKLRSG